MQLKTSTEQQSNSLDEMAYTSKVAKFLGEGNIFNPALSSNRDKSSLCPIEMEITWIEERILKGARGLTIRLLTRDRSKYKIDISLIDALSNIL